MLCICVYCVYALENSLFKDAASYEYRNDICIIMQSEWPHKMLA